MLSKNKMSVLIKIYLFIFGIFRFELEQVYCIDLKNNILSVRFSPAQQVFDKIY